MKKHHLFTFLTLPFIFLQACGSSSTDGSTSNKEYTFNIEGLLANQCAQQQGFSLYSVYLQDDQWNVLSSYSADANGDISITATTDVINFTLVAETQSGDSETGLDVRSYFDVPTQTSASYQAKYDALQVNDTCECVTQDVSLRHRSFFLKTDFASSLDSSGWTDESDQVSVFEGVTACKTIDGEWPVSSFAVIGEDAQGGIIGSAEIVSDYSSVDLSAIDVASNYLLDESHPTMTISQLFAGDQHFTTEVLEGADHAPVFDSHTYIGEAQHIAITSAEIANISSLFGSSVYSVTRQLVSDDASSVLDIELPSIIPNLDYEYFSEMAEDGTYDYTEAGAKVAKITFVYEVMNEEGYSIPVSWMMYGPLEGTLPMTVGLPSISNIINTETNIEMTQVVLIDSDESNNYNDYILHYLGDEVDGIEDSMTRYQLNLSLE
jgi:hypothetical protein